MKDELEEPVLSLIEGLGKGLPLDKNIRLLAHWKASENRS